MAHPRSQVELEVERLAKSGDGVARHHGRTVFVEGALPRERVSVTLSEGKVLRGELTAVLAPSPQRRPPPCALAAQCGGCSWLHLEEAAQREWKEEIVTSTLDHIGGIVRQEYQLLPTVFGAKPMRYRRRASLVPVEGGWGFFGRRSHQRVRVESCPALVPELDGLLREVGPMPDVEELRLVSDDDGLGLSLHLKNEVRPAVRARAEKLLRLAACVAVVPARGPLEVLGAKAPRADLFAQANAEVNALLTRAAAEALGADGAALELYAGSGNFTALLAPPVTAVESAPSAPSIPSTRWIRGDVPQVVKGLIAERARFPRMLLDPPRSGAPGVDQWASRLGAQRVIYVACDVASLARDAQQLKGAGFRPVSVQLFDMFPQTHHVEVLMRFDRAGSPAA